MNEPAGGKMPFFLKAPQMLSIHDIRSINIMIAEPRGESGSRSNLGRMAENKATKRPRGEGWIDVLYG